MYVVVWAVSRASCPYPAMAIYVFYPLRASVYTNACLRASDI